MQMFEKPKAQKRLFLMPLKYFKLFLTSGYCKFFWYITPILPDSFRMYQLLLCLSAFQCGFLQYRRKVKVKILL